MDCIARQDRWDHACNDEELEDRRAHRAGLPDIRILPCGNYQGCPYYRNYDRQERLD